MTLNILLARIETERDLYLPLGLMYIADALQKAGYNPTILHVHSSGMRDFRTAVRELEPILVGFSVTTGRHILPTLEASRLAHDAGVPVIWGGVHPTILPELCLNESCVDAVVLGEGEITLVELADRLGDEGRWNPPSLTDIPGTAIKLENTCCFNEPRDLVKDIDRYRPAYHLVDIPRYYMSVGDSVRGLQVTTSRGCPYNCGFCCISSIMKHSVRKHSVLYMRELLTQLRTDYAMDALVFHDDLLFSDVNRVKEILERQPSPWWGEIRAGQVDADLATWLKGSDCHTLFIGAESGSQRMLDAINKRIKVEEILDTAVILDNQGIHSEFSFIQGLPGETGTDRQLTYDLIDRIEQTSPLATCGLKFYTPYPGTPLWKSAIRSGFQPPRTNLEWSNIDRFHSTLPWLNSIDKNAVKVRNSLVNSRNSMTVQSSSNRTTAGISLFESIRSVYRFLSAPLVILEQKTARYCWRKRRFRFPATVYILQFLRLRLDAISSWMRNILKRSLLKR